MNNIEIKTKVITNSIVREIRDTAHKNIDIGLVAGTVREILSDDGLLDAIKNVAWDEDDKKGVCAFTPEQLLELAPNGFNPCPIDLFVKGELDLKHAIEESINHMWTVSMLQTHPHGIIVCDEPACAEIKVGTYRYFKDKERIEGLAEQYL